MHIAKSLILAALFLLAAGLPPAFADQPPCRTPETIKAEAVKYLPNNPQFDDIPPEILVNTLKKANAIPPVSNIYGDYAFVMSEDNDPTYAIVVFQNNCLVAPIALSQTQFFEIMSVETY